MSTLYIYLGDTTPSTDVFTTLNQIGQNTAISESSAITDSVAMLRSHTMTVSDSTATTSIVSSAPTVSITQTLSNYKTAKIAEASARSTYDTSHAFADYNAWLLTVATLEIALQADSNAQAAVALAAGE